MPLNLEFIFILHILVVDVYDLFIKFQYDLFDFLPVG